MAAVNGENVHTPSKGKRQAWTYEQELALLEKVENYLGTTEGSKEVYVKDIAWSNMAFDGFSEEDVHKRWNSLTSKVRKLRTAKEILEDAKQMMADKKENNVESRKRKRDDKDPALPKLPITSYLIFCKEKQPGFAEKYATLSSQELRVKMGKKWRKLSDEKKKKYQDMYLENRKKYEHDLTQYYIEHFPEQKAPKTAFDLWSEEKEKEIKEDRPEISDKKMKKKLKKRWEKLDDKDKEKWEKKSKPEIDKYLRKMRKKCKV